MKLLLIDGSNLIFRAYFASENQKGTNKDGTPINAVKTTISMLDGIINKEKPTHIFMALDSGKATFRHKLYEEYKGKRESAPESLKLQFPIIIDLFTALGINHYSTDEYEADDLIATYAKEAKRLNIPVKIITGDKDLLQLVDDNTTVLTPKMGFAKECIYTPETFIEKFTFTPERMIEYKALVGDPSDNIIGVAKLGDKTAKKLLNQYDDIEEIITAAKNEEIKGKLKENIISSIDNIHTNIKLVTLVKTTEIPFSLETLSFEHYNYQTYGEFLRTHGFVKQYNELIDKGLFDEVAGQDDTFVRFEDLQYEEITSFEEKEHLPIDTSEEIFIYTETLEDNYFLSTNLGFGITSSKGTFYLSFKNIGKTFKNFFENDRPKIIYNAKKVIATLKLNKINNLNFDPFLATAVLNSNNFNKEITNVFSDFGIHYLKPFDKIYGSKTKPQILDEDLSKRDIISKTIAIKEISNKIKKIIKKEELEKILYEIEMPLSQVLAKMELNGINIDLKKLNEVEKIFEKEDKKLLGKLKEITEINVSSPMQLSNFLFETWNLPKFKLKKTTKGISTDIDNLEKLNVILNEKKEEYQKEINFLELISKYRKNGKILNTYLKNLKKFILEDNKVHPINNQLLAETGRLSVMDPNIQNMPIKGEYSKYIRNLFAAPKNSKIIAFDYSQIELRVMAVFANDQNMIEAFNQNRDIHAETAKKMFGIEEVTQEQRSRAKAINFGIIYGMSSYGLAKQLNITNDEAKLFIEKYFEEYPQIKKFMEDIKIETEENKYVKTLFGRKRQIPNINSKNHKEKEHSQRMAINTPIQGTAADILKMALILVEEDLKVKKFSTKMIMQIHDEIVLEVPISEEKEIIELVKNAMENVVALPVKLKVDYGSGVNWLETK